MTADTVWTNARLWTGTGALVDDGAVAAKDGVIVYAGPANAAPGANRSIDCGGRLITPGLVDCHTHIVHAGNRANEWRMRLEGASYEEVARAGGGIVSTVKNVRAASEDELVRQSLPRLDALIAEGVTTIEVKSGYGLERRQRVQDAARRPPSGARAAGWCDHDASGGACHAAGINRQGCLHRGRRRAAIAACARARPRRCGRRLHRGHRLLGRADAACLRGRQGFGIAGEDPCRAVVQSRRRSHGGLGVWRAVGRSHRVFG